MAKTKYIKAISEHDSFDSPINKLLNEEGEEWTEELAFKIQDGKVVDVMDIPFIQDLNDSNGNIPTENESQISVVKNPYIGHTEEEIKEIIESRDFSCKNVAFQEILESEWNSLEIIRQKEIERAKNWKNNDSFAIQKANKNNLNTQRLRRQNDERKFSTSHDIAKAKERVMSHLKERHPNMTEKTIKNKAKINHLKGKIKTSKLIGRDITD